MRKKYKLSVFMLMICTSVCLSQEKRGANISYITTYEAENMVSTGTILSPIYEPYHVEFESSGLQCIMLDETGQFLDFNATSEANSMVIRYSIKDHYDNTETQPSLGIYKKGKLIKTVELTSRYSHLYGDYPFTNDQQAGKPRNFYDEIRINGLKISKGDEIKIQYNAPNGEEKGYCIVDLIDLEKCEAPLKAPAGSLSLTDLEFTGNLNLTDYTDAFRRCIAKAIEKKKIVWIPAGTYTLTGDLIIPSNVTIKGAGKWHTLLVGDENYYSDPARRVRLKGNGNNIHLSGFSIIGKLNYRNDSEPNDGIVGTFGINSTISDIWIEHTKVGIWVENSKNLLVEDCRFRNTLADGVNFCVGMTSSTIRNCTARGTGDDCFAIWPATFMDQEYFPGKNLIVNCTGQLPFLANGAAIYGGESNHISNCTFADITTGSAILISTTFPTSSKERNLNNNFCGTTVIENCDIKSSGGFDHTWGWRGAVQICLDKRDINGIEINNLDVEKSLSDGISIIANNENGEIGRLTKATFRNINVLNSGIAIANRYGLLIEKDTHGNLNLIDINIPETKNRSVDFTIKRGNY